MRIETLDGRVLMLNVDEVINPKTVRKIAGEGMPIYSRFVKNDHEVQNFGDLYVKFKITFPKQLSEDQKVRIEKVLN